MIACERFDGLVDEDCHSTPTNQANEQTRHLIVVHVYDEGRPAPPALAEHVKMIDEVSRL